MQLSIILRFSFRGERGLNPLRGCCWCILQPKLTERSLSYLYLSFYIYIYIYLTQGNFFKTDFKRFEFRGFLLLNRLPYQVYRTQSALQFTNCSSENNWTHTFPRGISAMRNADTHTHTHTHTHIYIYILVGIVTMKEKLWRKFSPFSMQQEHEHMYFHFSIDAPFSRSIPCTIFTDVIPVCTVGKWHHLYKTHRHIPILTKHNQNDIIVK